MFCKNKKGQSTLEYALVVVVAVAALLAMQIYVKRAFQGKTKENIDSIGQQFEAANTTMHVTTAKNGSRVQTYGIAAAGESRVNISETEVISGNENVTAW